jgi:molecular chaperone DnaK
VSRIVGIDLGTTNSLVAVVDSGIPLVLADAAGRRLTPSVVHLPGPDAAPVVGHEAVRVRALRPRETVYSAKRFIGRRGPDLAREELRVNYAVNSAGAGPVTFDLHGRAWLPEEIAAEVLKKLKADVEAALGETVSRAVITVPAYFNDAQRQATKRAGELAGFIVERLLNEPTAAALAAGLDRLQDRARVAVYDLGGGTFDLSILELNQGVFQVLATNGNTCLGGDDLDQRLVAFLAERIRDAGGPDLTQASATLSTTWGENAPNPFAPGAPEPLRGAPASGTARFDRQTGAVPEAGAPVPGGRAASPTRGAHQVHGHLDLLPLLARLREAAEQAKIRLSTETEVEITLPFLTPEFSFSHRLARADLERLTRDLIERTRPHCLRALADAKLDPRDLDQVILVGGQTRMPLVRRLVAEWFACAEFDEARGPLRVGADPHRADGPRLHTGVNPDEAVALGAAIQAEILRGGFRNVLLLDVTPLSLGLETFGGLMNVIIPRNTTIPVKAGEMFTTAVDQQRSMLIHVLQGERERARDNWSLGRFALDFEPAPRGVPRVGVQFEIDADGILRVLARDTRTGHQKIVDMKSAVDVDDADVQRMVEESVEHFHEDTRARAWIEAVQRARPTLDATRAGLAECGAALDAAPRQRIERAAAAVETALAAVDPAEQTGDPARLRVAVAELDEATKPLADLLMDRAMDEMLRRRGLMQDAPPKG